MLEVPAEVLMSPRCANPDCRFEYYSMRAICPDPGCLEEPRPGCGRYFRFLPEGKVEKLAPDATPAPLEENVAWLCCYCAMEYEPVAPGRFRLAPDPLAFIWRWQIENGEASVAHEAG